MGLSLLGAYEEDEDDEPEPSPPSNKVFFYFSLKILYSRHPRFFLNHLPQRYRISAFVFE